MKRDGHYSDRTAWLRAAVLGADDGIVSTASLMVGVASSSASVGAVLVAGVAGMFAGAMAMAAGEYVSVASQLDAERTDITREEDELHADPEGERLELERIYQNRGLSPQLAAEVAEQLSAGDPLIVHLRDELGIQRERLARPIQAAVVSSISFALGAALPILSAIIGERHLILTVVLATLLALAVLGAIGAQAGGASVGRGAFRVLIGGVGAMAVTALIGNAVGEIAL